MKTLNLYSVKFTGGANTPDNPNPVGGDLVAVPGDAFDAAAVVLRGISKHGDPKKRPAIKSVTVEYLQTIGQYSNNGREKFISDGSETMFASIARNGLHQIAGGR
jgi:hypothetical protein